MLPSPSGLHAHTPECRPEGQKVPAIARFDQVEGVSDAERDKAWKRILAAAKRFDIEVSESDWRDLAKGGKDRKR